MRIDLAELLHRGTCGVPAEATPPEPRDGAASPTLKEELVTRQSSGVSQLHKLQSPREEQAEEADPHFRLQLSSFLEKHGFSGINVPRRSFLRKTFALHKAAELADVATTTLLLAEGADVSLRNSSGRTAADVAKKKDNCGSHAAVFNLLVEAGTTRASTKTQPHPPFANKP